MKKMNERLRNGLVNIGLVVMSVVVFFVVLEGYFAVFDPQIYKGPGGRLPFFQHDEMLGWVCKPNAEGIYGMTEEYTIHVKINSKGLRDREYNYSKPDGIKRIVVLGDSFTWGIGVEDKERYTEILEDSLLKNIQVMNMGAAGYGNDQELLFLREEGVKYSPDVVIVAFYHNDLTNNMHSFQYFQYKPMFVLDAENKLILTNVPVPQKGFLSFGMLLYTHSHTFHFLFERLQSRGILDKLIKMVFGKKDASTTNVSYITERQNGYNLTKAILREIDAVAEANNAKTMIVIFPFRAHVKNKNCDPEINGALVDFGKESNIPVLDLLPEFREHAKNGEQLYFKNDSHWNANGHRLAAELIYDKLIEEQLIPLGGEE